MDKKVNISRQKPELTVKNLELAIFGKVCMHCGFNEMHLLYDSRYLCASCNKKINPRQIYTWLKILHCFSVGLPISRTAKDMGYSYNKVKNIYYQIQMAIQNQRINDLTDLSGVITNEIHTVKKHKLLSKKPMYILIIHEELNNKLRCRLFWKHKNIMTYLNPDKLISVKKIKTSSKNLKNDFESKFYDKRIILQTTSNFKIENFIQQLSARLSVLHGVNDENLELYVSELEYRSNHAPDTIYHELVHLVFSPIINQK